MREPNFFLAIGGPVLMLAGVYLRVDFRLERVGTYVGIIGALVTLGAIFSAWK